MKKKTTVLLALISMCLIATAGIGAVSASDEPSDEPVGVVSVGKINPDGSHTVLGIFESSEPTEGTVTRNEDGSTSITKNGIPVPEDELCDSLDVPPKTLFYRPVPVMASDDDEPAVSATVGEISPDGTVTPIKTFRGSGPMSVIVTRNEDGSMNITKSDIYSYKRQEVVNHRIYPTWYTHIHVRPFAGSNSNR